MPDERTDSELLLASRDNPDAFTELYRRHAEDLLRYFARRTLDPETAAELTAETFAEAFASRQRYTDQGVNGVAWVYGIARHRLGRTLRGLDASACAHAIIEVVMTPRISALVLVAAVVVGCARGTDTVTKLTVPADPSSSANVSAFVTTHLVLDLTTDFAAKN